MGDRISPTRPGVTPQPAATTPDRDGRETTVATPARERRKKKNVPMKPDSEKPKDPKAPGSHIDIRTLQIETARVSNQELSSA